MELVVSGNPAVVHAIEDKTNRKLPRQLADVKESLLFEVIAVLQPFDIATASAFLVTVRRHCTIYLTLLDFKVSHFWCFVAYMTSAIFDVGDSDGDRL